MKKTNTNFFRSILLASFLLATYMSQAQMHPFKSAERVVNLQTRDSSKSLIRTIDEKNLISSYEPFSFNAICFIWTTQGQTNAEFAALTQIHHVYDFKILNNWLFFCGQDNNGLGFIARVRVFELFESYTNTIEIMSLPGVSEVNKMEVYEGAYNEYYIAAIGDHRHFIYTIMEEPNYYIYTSPFPLSDVVTTDNHIVVLGKKNLDSLALFTHPKVNIQNYFGMSYAHNQARFENFLIERLFGDNVLVSYTDRPNGYQAQFVRIDARTLQPIAQQSLSDKGKPNQKEMVFNPADSTVLYLSHAVENKDMIATIKPYLNYSYPSDVIIPNMCKWGHETLNSLTAYHDNYLSAIGVDTTTSHLYWFDYKRGTTNLCNCFKVFKEKVIMANTFIPSTRQNYQGIQVLQKQPQTIQVQHFTPQYNVICND